MKKHPLLALILTLVCVAGFALPAVAAAKGENPAQERGTSMKTLHFFMDTHDRTKGTFPEKLTQEEFEGFFAKFERACAEEGVIPVRLHVSYADGRTFCLLMAPDADAVKRAHDRVGLPFDSITEVTMATPGDTFFRRP